MTVSAGHVDRYPVGYAIDWITVTSCRCKLNRWADDRFVMHMVKYKTVCLKTSVLSGWYPKTMFQLPI